MHRENDDLKKDHSSVQEVLNKQMHADKNAHIIELNQITAIILLKVSDIINSIPQFYHLNQSTDRNHL